MISFGGKLVTDERRRNCNEDGRTLANLKDQPPKRSVGPIKCTVPTLDPRLKKLKIGDIPSAARAKEFRKIAQYWMKMKEFWVLL